MTWGLMFGLSSYTAHQSLKLDPGLTSLWTPFERSIDHSSVLHALQYPSLGGARDY
jgi:hypothetical protein